MANDSNPPPRPGSSPPPRSPADRAADEARFVEISDALADAIEVTVPRWIERLVVACVRDWSGHVSAEVAASAVTAGEAARDDVMPRMRALLATDVDAQRANPLALLRDATRHAHAVLAELGMPSTPRDQFSQRSFPDDAYGLVPATWEDVDPSLQELGITWGAAKAFVHKARRRDEGLT